MPRFYRGVMDQQPQGAVEIDYDNPLAAGIINAFTGSLGAPVIGSRLVTRSGGAISQTSTTKGHILGGFNGSSYVVVDSNARIADGTFTCICIVVANNTNGYVYYASEGGSGTAKGWSFGQSATTSANKIGMTWGGVADYSLSTGTLTTGVPTVVGVVVSRSGGTARYYIDGQFDSSRAVGTFAGAGLTPLTLGAANGGAGYSNMLPAGYGVGFCAVWNRALSDHEVAQVSANPWQLFRDSSGLVFVPTAGGITDLASDALLGVTGAGTLTVDKPLVAAAALSVTATGAVSVPKPIASAAAIYVTSAAPLSAPKPLTADAALSVLSVGAMSVPKPLASTAAVVAVTSSADLAAGSGFSANAVMLVTASAEMNVPKPLAASALFLIASAAALTVAKPLSSNASVALTADGALTAPRPLNAAANIVVVAIGALTVSRPLSAAAQFSLGSAGAIVVLKPLSASALVSFRASGGLLDLLAAYIDGTLTGGPRYSGSLYVGLRSSGALQHVLRNASALTILAGAP